MCLQGNPRKHATWLASRPRRFEKNAVRALIAALRATSDKPTKPGFSLHIVHLAGAPQHVHWRQRPGRQPDSPQLSRLGTAGTAGSTCSAAGTPPLTLTPTAAGIMSVCTFCADADLLPELAAAKAEGLPLTVETCPHYLNFASERVKTGDTRYAAAADANGWLAPWLAAPTRASVRALFCILRAAC